LHWLSIITLANDVTSLATLQTSPCAQAVRRDGSAIDLAYAAQGVSVAGKMAESRDIAAGVLLIQRLEDE
jgi:hypothetical protein